jgi:cytosine deaminase
MDVIIRNSRVRGSEKLMDIGITNTTITEIQEKIKANALIELNAHGNLVTPSFIDAHEHLDDAFIGEYTRMNESGTLQEAIQILRDAKRQYSVEDVKKRALRAIQMLVDRGTTHIRSHANVDSFSGLNSIKGLIEARKESQELASIQVVAFPQEAITKEANSAELMWKSMELGADLVGGMPAGELTEEDSRKHIDIVFDIAKEFNAGIDMHIDENDDPNSRTLQYFATKAIKENHSNVTASHACALAYYDESYAQKTIELMKLAKMSVIANPCTNLMLQGRLDKQPIRRGITRVKDLHAAGVNVACGQDGINDPFDQLTGKCDMLQIAWIMGHAAHLSTPSEMEYLFDMITTNAAIALKLERYGLSIGNEADLNILDGRNIYDAIRMQPDMLYVIKSGKIVGGTKRQT